MLVGQDSLQALHRPSLGVGGATGESRTYIVQPGDTASQIAEKFNISTNTVLWANGLAASSVIKPGDELTILPFSGVRHKVKQGENVSAIAYEYDVDIEAIIEANDLGSDGFIRAGEWLVVPGGTPPVRSRTQRYAATTNTGASFIYPASGKNWGYLHAVNAVDIANSCGTPVYAAAGGTVTTAYNSGWHGGYGRYIKVSHPGGIVTLYAHLNQVIAYSGWVNQGQQIGVLGNSGNSTGCHLHFEVRGARNSFAGSTEWVKAGQAP